MKNFELNTEEKSRILSLHKRMIQEQGQTGPSVPNTNNSQSAKQIAGLQTPPQPTLDENNEQLVRLRNYIKIGCLPAGGEILSNKDYTKFIYRFVNNNNIRLFFLYYLSNKNLP